MRLIGYKSPNPFRLAITPSEYDEEFVVASINAFINNLESIDNGVPKNLANQNRAPCQLIKKRAKNKGFSNSISNAHIISQRSTHCESGELKPRGQIQFDSKSTRILSIQLHSFKKVETLSNCKISLDTISQNTTMSSNQKQKF